MSNVKPITHYLGAKVLHNVKGCQVQVIMII